MNLKEQFDEARKAWPGVKSGLDVEWDNLCKVCRAHKLNGSKIIPELLPSIERYESYRKQRTINNDFVEPYCSFTVYINGRRWTREYPAAACGTVSKTPLYPLKGKTCGKRGCRMPAVYHDSSGNYDSYACPEHMPDKVKELYD